MDFVMKAENNWRDSLPQLSSNVALTATFSSFFFFFPDTISPSSPSGLPS